MSIRLRQSQRKPQQGPAEISPTYPYEEKPVSEKEGNVQDKPERYPYEEPEKAKPEKYPLPERGEHRFPQKQETSTLPHQPQTQDARSQDVAPNLKRFFFGIKLLEPGTDSGKPRNEMRGWVASKKRGGES